MDESNRQLVVDITNSSMVADVIRYMDVNNTAAVVTVDLVTLIEEVTFRFGFISSTLVVDLPTVTTNSRR